MSAKTRFHFDRLYGMSPQQYEHVAVWQVGDIGCHAVFRLEPHIQSCYEIVYVLSGRGWFSVNGERFDVDEGELHIVNPGETHAGGVDPELPYRCFYLGFTFNDSRCDEPGNPFERIKHVLDGAFDCKGADERVGRRSAEHAVERAGQPEAACAAASASARAVRDRLGIRHPVLGLLRELRHANEHSRLMLQSYLHQIIVLAYRNAYSGWDSDDHYCHELTSAE